jgi:hypothetical protein
VDDHLGALGGDEHDELEGIRGAVRADDEPSVGVVGQSSTAMASPSHTTSPHLSWDGRMWATRSPAIFS